MTLKEEFLTQCLIVDYETTSNDFHTAEIIEAGFVIREKNNWTIFQDLHKPVNTHIPPAVSALTYITNDMVANCPTFIESKDVFQSAINNFMDNYIVGHNYFYDMKVGEHYGVIFPSKSICTWRIAKKLFNNMSEIESTNLPYLRFALNLDVPIEMMSHRAGNDCYMTGKLLEVFVDMMVELKIIDDTLPFGPQIHTWVHTPIIYSHMPFGKHKGAPMKLVPKDYWVWAINNFDSLKEESENYDVDLVESIKIALED